MTNSSLVPGIVRAAWDGMLDVEIRVMGYLSAATSGGSILLFIVLNVDEGPCWSQLSVGSIKEVSIIFKNKELNMHTVFLGCTMSRFQLG